MTNRHCLLIINGGSSSIKFAVYEIGSLTLIMSGKVSERATDSSILEYTTTNLNSATRTIKQTIKSSDSSLPILELVERAQGIFIIAVVHRVVMGMKYSHSQIINSEMIAYLRTLAIYDPEHIPEELRLIESFMKHFPSISHIACFDTAFHLTMPDVAKRIAIPRRFAEKGINRYGFHGISYSFLMGELKDIGDRNETEGRVILAHLGSGASVAAVKAGRCIDTSMGFSPAAGLPMSTRCGDLDPGVAGYLMQIEKLTASEFNKLINHESGLLGISELSSDIRELLKLRSGDHRAAEAVEFFCYQIKKWVGSYAAVLNGLDTLVFSGGIGENLPEIRKSVCSDLNFLGILLDDKRNSDNEAIISSDESAVRVRVIRTNEELMMAKIAGPVLGK